jgi:hypothetical protein
VPAPPAGEMAARSVPRRVMAGVTVLRAVLAHLGAATHAGLAAYRWLVACPSRVKPGLMPTSRGDRLTAMVKPMKRRDVNRALRRNGCVIKNDKGRHTTWICGCGGQHTRRHSPPPGDLGGVIGDTIERMKCLPEGWLQ